MSTMPDDQDRGHAAWMRHYQQAAQRRDLSARQWRRHPLNKQRRRRRMAIIFGWALLAATGGLFIAAAVYL
jgi:hypothetical protein